jgi:hypothetical protein
MRKKQTIKKRKRTGKNYRTYSKGASRTNSKGGVKFSRTSRTYSKGASRTSRTTTPSESSISEKNGSDIRHHLVQLLKNNNVAEYNEYTSQIRLNENMLKDFYTHLDEKLHTFSFNTIDKLAPCLSQLQEETEPKANLYLHYINDIINSGNVHGIPFKDYIKVLSREHSKKHSRFVKQLKSDIYKQHHRQ